MKISTGAERITAERKRQILSEGWTAEHDDEHTDSSLALAAICYAAPERMYVKRHSLNGVVFTDPWPVSWTHEWDKRFRYGERRGNSGNILPHPDSYSRDERLDLLTKAGALIAAEIDRLLREENHE